MERSKKFLKLAVFGIQIPMFLIEVVSLKRTYGTGRGGFFRRFRLRRGFGGQAWLGPRAPGRKTEDGVGW